MGLWVLGGLETKDGLKISGERKGGRKGSLADALLGRFGDVAVLK